MPIDQSTDPVTATTRRTFLVRAAVGGALVTAGAVAAPVGPFLGIAGAQESGEELLNDAEFGVFATPLELAAVLVYVAAIDAELLDEEWTSRARQFQAHHEAVATTLGTLRGEDASPAEPDEALLEQGTTAIEAATDQAGVLQVLADLEDTLAATHLASVPVLRESFTAATVAQVLFVESQQAALLATAAGGSIEDATPATATTDASVLPDGLAPATTTTTAAN